MPLLSAWWLPAAAGCRLRQPEPGKMVASPPPQPTFSATANKLDGGQKPGMVLHPDLRVPQGNPLRTLNSSSITESGRRHSLKVAS